MGNESQCNNNLHVVFFPFMAYGHMIPTLDTAKLFLARGVKCTIITTPLNLLFFTKSINENTKKNGELLLIEIEVFRFPSLENGLSKECENLEQAMMSLDMAEKFIKAASMLRQQLEHYLEKTRPHCLVADMFFPWATECATKFNIPRIVFHGISLFAHCAKEMILVYQPYKDVSNDEEMFVVPFLPHEIMLTRSQLPKEYLVLENEHSQLKRRHEMIQESEVQCFGVLVNSFYELEPDYADFFREKMGRRAWHIGPVSLCNKSLKENKVQRGGDDVHECLKCLSLKRPNSVIYVCFGSLAHFIVPQLQEIALALEELEYEFIWVVNKEDKYQMSEEWLPKGFKERTRGKGLVIGGWVPQMLILEHEAVGVFVTHCGWNSTLEAISSGVPMVTWPLFAEQFYNEKLVNNVLKIGTPVGATKWEVMHSIEDLVKCNDILNAVRDIMDGDEALERRNKVKKLKNMARKSMEDNGSSYCDLSSLINELRDYHARNHS